MSAQVPPVSSTSPEMFDGEYIVEKILAHKYEVGRKLYLIKWLGFDDQVQKLY